MTRPPEVRHRTITPGLLLVVAVAASCYLLALKLVVVSALLLAIVAGAAARNAGILPGWSQPGITWSAKRLLRAGVVLLGFRLALPQVLALGWGGIAVILLTVTVTFVGTRALGRWLQVPPTMGLLVATGFSICGAAAIAAMSATVSDDADDDIATAVALVTLYGSALIPVLPVLVHLLGLDDDSAGLWIGASVHEVAQVVAASSIVGTAALAVATVTKLGRVVLLAPLVAIVAATRRRGRAIHDIAPRDGQPAADQRPLSAWRRIIARVSSVVPLFVLGFLAAVALRSAGVVPDGLLRIFDTCATLLLTAAMFALGTGVHLGSLVKTGGRALALGAASTMLALTISLAGVLALG